MFERTLWIVEFLMLILSFEIVAKHNAGENHDERIWHLVDLKFGNAVLLTAKALKRKLNWKKN